MNKKLSIAVLVALLTLSVFLFFLGLGIGLQHSPNLGTVLWLLSLLSGGIGIFVLIRVLDKK